MRISYIPKGCFVSREKFKLVVCSVIQQEHARSVIHYDHRLTKYTFWHAANSKSTPSEIQRVAYALFIKPLSAKGDFD